ncbi:signal peptidase I [Coxiella burnetii]|uniref:signal peptidase I n=1 Tax=Coxiella burnetii TaxID=777 RepID=UPI0021767ED6|nr:signal peptidase I [Coxiella burnetii]
MIFDFLNILSLLTIFAGVVWLVDILWRRIKKIPIEKGTKPPLIIDYARSFFPILLIVLIIRSFLFQPYRVPTGSLEPTIMPGDMILVNQYDYGLRVPLWNKKIVDVGEPKRGQIALFRWPVNPAATFVKRVIGVPGDRVSYQDKVFYINGKEMSQKFIKNTLEIGDDGKTWPAKEYEEDLNGVKHLIILRPDRPAQNFKDLIVPKGKYLMIGDNRDDSDDTRSWGFVPARNFIGRAILIWMSWDSQKDRVRWERIGDRL